MENKVFYKSLLTIMIPMALQSIITFCVQTLDTIMIGALGDTAVSAVSLANQPYFIFAALVLGLSGGGTVLISQYWGKGDTYVIRKIMALMMWLTFIFASLYCLICFLFPRQIMTIFSSDPMVIEKGIQYLKIIVFSYILNGISSSYLASLRATENVKVSTYIFSISFLVNLVLNYILIFGKFGFPTMGINGAAVATIIARGTECLACFIYAKWKETKIGFSFTDLFSIDCLILPDFLKLSFPVILHELNWSLASSAQIAIIGNLSSIFLTAESIAVIAQQLGMIFLYGVSSAAAIMIGKVIGSGNESQAKHLSYKFLKLSVCIGVFACILILLIRTPLLMVYPNISLESKELAYQIMGVLAFITISISIEYTCTIGILRGSGDTTFAFLIDSGCMWFISMPLGYVAAYIWHLPFVAIFLCLKIDSLFKIIICLLRIRKGHFINNVTKNINYTV